MLARPGTLLIAAVVAAVVGLADGSSSAGGEPDSWAYAACRADAVMEVEVSFPSDRDGETQVRVVTTHFRNSRRGFRPGLDVPGRIEGRRMLRKRLELLSGAPHLAANSRLIEAALRRGRYRMIALAVDLPNRTWLDLDSTGLLGQHKENWLEHAGHGRWWREVRALLAERTRLAAAGKKPALCEAADRYLTDSHACDQIMSFEERARSLSRPKTADGGAQRFEECRW